MTTTTTTGSFFGVEGLGRSFLVGSALGAVGTFAVMTGIVYVGTGLWLPSIGVGLYAAFWGGPGFGGMLGGVSAMIRDEHAQAEASADVALASVATGPIAATAATNIDLPVDRRVSSAA